MHIIIPARYASGRLPGKPLADVAGKTLLERVYDRARASEARWVTIATDDQRIAKAARIFGADVIMTHGSHRSGTERIGEVINRLGIKPDEIVVNLQGDEPLMPPGLIRSVAHRLDCERGAASVATACHPISDQADMTNTNTVKVVCDINGYALYFSRAPIAYGFAQRHIGLYAYRAGFVTRFCYWPPCALEEQEKLEQLRILWYGERIAVTTTDETPPIGVDTAEDLERVRKIFSGEANRG